LPFLDVSELEEDRFLEEIDKEREGPATGSA